MRGKTNENYCLQRVFIMSNEKILKKGIKYYKEKKYWRALIIYLWVLIKDSQNLQAWVNLGGVLINKRKYKLVLKACEKAQNINDSEIIVKFFKAIALTELKRYQEALEEYNNIIEIEPDFLPAWQNKGYILRELERYGEAIEAYDEYLRIIPNTVDILYFRGLTKNKQKQYKKAIEDFDSVIAIKPDDIDARIDKAISYWKMEDNESALEAIDQALELDDMNVGALNVKGGILAGMKKYYEAEPYFEKITRINRKYAPAWYNKGIMLSQIGEHKLAYKAFKKASNLRPDNIESWINLGHSLAMMGKNKSAIKIYKKIRKLKPQYVPVLINFSASLSDLGKFNESLQIINLAISIDPTISQAWVNKGSALINLGKKNLGILAYEKAIELNPTDASHYRYLGKIQFEFGNYSKSLELIRRAIELDKDSSKAYRIKGKIDLYERRYAEAIKSFNEAKLLNAGNPVDLLWGIYSKFLKTEYSKKKDEIEYQENINAFIRELKQVLVILNNEPDFKDKKGMKAYVYYLLGVFYLKIKDYYSAVEKLKKCLKLDKKNTIFPYVRNLLLEIWEKLIRPSWWRWWWYFPLNNLLFKGIASLLVASIFTLLCIPPFFPELAKLISWDLEINWTIYYLLIVSLFVILLLPSVVSFKASGFQVELQSQVAPEVVLSPVILEEKIRAIEQLEKRDPESFEFDESEEKKLETLKLD